MTHLLVEEAVLAYVDALDEKRERDAQAWQTAYEQAEAAVRGHGG